VSLGGSIEVAGLSFEDDGKGGPRLALKLALDDLDLAEVGRAVGMPALSGRLGGDLGVIRVDAESVRVEGALEAKAFGGRIVLSNLHVDEPFARVPEFGLDARVEEVDMATLTQAFGLGRVSGVLEGYVKDLVVADDQPQSFEADLHTVERKGVPQNVDVRAIVQLGVLGGGDSGSVTGTLLKVIDRYRYSAMGIRARLANDEFELRGVESREGRDYIVKGSLLPPSVSVVSHSQVVSFSEMLRRIRTIAGSDAAKEGGSPDGAAP
jgi:hypothetical protein